MGEIKARAKNDSSVFFLFVPPPFDPFLQTQLSQHLKNTKPRRRRRLRHHHPAPGHPQARARLHLRVLREAARREGRAREDSPEGGTRRARGEVEQKGEQGRRSQGRCRLPRGLSLPLPLPRRARPGATGRSRCRRRRLGLLGQRRLPRLTGPHPLRQFLRRSRRALGLCRRRRFWNKRLPFARGDQGEVRDRDGPLEGRGRGDQGGLRLGV